MSGGSYDYIFTRLNDAADYARDIEVKMLLRDLSEVLHDDEWAYDGDISDEAYKKTLTEFKKKWFKDDRADRLKGIVDEEINKLRDELYDTIGICDWSGRDE